MPVEFDKPGRNVQHMRGFFDSQTAEESQFHDATLTLIQLFQPHQCLVEREKIDGRCEVRVGSGRVAVNQRDALALAAALARVVALSMMNKNPPHGLRRDRVEVCPSLPLHTVLVDEFEIRFVHQRGRLECVIAALALQEMPCERAQFLIHQRQQLLNRRAMSLLHGGEDSRDLLLGCRRCRCQTVHHLRNGTTHRPVPRPSRSATHLF